MKFSSFLFVALPWCFRLHLACGHQDVGTEISPSHSLKYGVRRSESEEPLKRTNVTSGTAVKTGTELRILCVGDSITYGRGSDRNGGGGDGYRLQLRDNLSKDKVVFAGTETIGTMDDGHFAAWPGKTVKYIHDHVGPSLTQRPNIILVHAGTNDIDDRSWLSTEGHDPAGIADRLGNLIDGMIKVCPDAVILVALIINTCDSHKKSGVPEYRSLIPGVVEKRRSAGEKVLAVDFTDFSLDDLYDCIHPTNAGYREMGDYWYDFITQVPKEWISDPVGKDPIRAESESDEDENLIATIQQAFAVLLNFKIPI